MDDQKIITLLWQRADSAIEALAKKFGNRLMSIAMNRFVFWYYTLSTVRPSIAANHFHFQPLYNLISSQPWNLT